MDPESGRFFTYDKKRLTRERVAGFALELAFQWLLSLGQFGLTLAHFARVSLAVSQDTSETTRKVTFGVQEVHQQAIKDAVDDVLPRLQSAGNRLVNAVVPQKGYSAAHDLVLERCAIGEPCLGQYSGELKLRTYPANRVFMRSDCAGLFRAACAESTKWLGQVIVCVEISPHGKFVRSRAELLVRERPRHEASNLWGWVGAPSLAPPPKNAPVAPPVVRAVPKAAAGPPRALPPTRAAPPPKRPFKQVWDALQKYYASWPTEPVVLLKQFFIEMAPRCRTQVANCSRVVTSNRRESLCWRVRSEYGYAQTKAEGRVRQGGAPPPVIVTESALRVYYETL